MRTVRVEGLPEAPLEAAAEFYAAWLPALLNPPPLGEGDHPQGGEEGSAGAAQAPSVSSDGLPPPPKGEDLLLIFPPAGHTHRAWRLAAVQELARQAAPRRVNAVAAVSGPAIAAAKAWLAAAPGITGQVLPLDGTGAGPVLSSQA